MNLRLMASLIHFVRSQSSLWDTRVAILQREGAACCSGRSHCNTQIGQACPVRVRLGIDDTRLSLLEQNELRFKEDDGAHSLTREYAKERHDELAAMSANLDTKLDDLARTALIIGAIVTGTAKISGFDATLFRSPLLVAGIAFLVPAGVDSRSSPARSSLAALALLLRRGQSLCRPRPLLNHLIVVTTLHRLSGSTGDLA